MERYTEAVHARMLDILRQGRDLTLATIRPDGYPQATTVSYVHEDLTLYAGIGLDSQKAHNIQHNHKVSATINLDYTDWNQIRGLSLGGKADFVRNAAEIDHISRALLGKFPQARTFVQGMPALRAQGLLFLRITPTVISLLDYSQGFGHTELYAVWPEPGQPALMETLAP
ncbi:pyridoxamine 5'-phosphate oxidase family protein [Duganella callida]|uniref:Pyridoxamine 5'-phosphate oxidase family protein n=1 Tax=Duganella callida TaxID=2561932 RepID=A0A4Y9SK03_9BURK|nr:pyridoxamine 5'-phosphate oxidase family protein [Duganella callida]TFW23131.1 pyridoxamine 5'-phosphate oxidase family protein [Duganella callida]